jgi:hypothetical protein
MTDHPPSPVMAAVGLVATAADGLRQLPHVLGSVGQAAVRRYDEFAVRGQEVLAGHPHPAHHPASHAASSTAPGQPTAAGPATRAGRRTAAGRTRAPGRTEAAGPATPAGPAETGGPAAGGPASGRPAEVADPWVVDVTPIGRTGPVALPDEVREEVAQMTPGADLAHGELPLDDFDHQTLPQLRGRLRTLGLAELVQLRDYEQAHAARLPVLTLLDNRIAKILADTGRKPSSER